MTRTPLSRSKGQGSTCRGGGILWRPPAQLVLRQIYATAACLEFLKLSRIETRSQQARNSITPLHVQVMWLRGGWLPWSGRDLGRPHTQHVLWSVYLSACLSVRRFVCLSADDMRLASEGSIAVISSSRLYLNQTARSIENTMKIK